MYYSSVEPTVFDCAELSIYEELWEAARTVTEREREPLAALYHHRTPDQTFLHFLRDHHRGPLGLDAGGSPVPGIVSLYNALPAGKSIYSRQYSEVLFHLNKIISEASLQENYAIRRLQERFIVQTASQVSEGEERVLTKPFYTAILFNKYGSVQELRSTFGHLKSLIWFGPV